MTLLLDLFNNDPHFFTQLCILCGAFLFGICYLHEADKEYKRKTVNEPEEITEETSDLSTRAPIPSWLRTNQVSKPD